MNNEPGCTPVSGVVNSFILGNLFFCISFISIHYNTQKIGEIKNQLQHIRVNLPPHLDHSQNLNHLHSQIVMNSKT